MSQDLTSFLTGLRAKKPRLAVSDPDLLEAAWQAHPRLHFFKSLPWGWNVLDAGAGSGGLTHWKGWLKPNRADLNLYGVDRHPGEFREFYAGWETLDLDREMPQFSGVDFNGFIAAHLIEYLDAPERLIALHRSKRVGRAAASAGVDRRKHAGETARVPADDAGAGNPNHRTAGVCRRASTATVVRVEPTVQCGAAENK